MSRKYKFTNKDGIYFISFSTVSWVDVFTRVVYKDILVENLRYCQNNKGLELFAWCIMTNHVHLIARAQEGFLLSNILRDFKKHTSKLLIKTIKENQKESRRAWMLEIFRTAGENKNANCSFQFWQQDNHPIEIWSEKVILQKLNYLHNNPVVAGIVRHPEDYLYSSARNYFDENYRGLLEIKLIT
jgi:REP element-mobilizing transposase RayT